MPDPQFRLATPREVALAILAPRFSRQTSETQLSLSAFQREGADRVLGILANHGFAMLCDSVGLGKTFTALAVIEAALKRGDRVCLVIPASLRRMWRQALRQLPGHSAVTLISHTSLGLGHIPARAFGLVVVDEAHAFRNPRTRRYQALRRVCAGAEVLLITATPINNSLSDLYFLLRLRCRDTLLAYRGVHSLRSALRSVEVRATDVAVIRHCLIVRRNRTDVQSRADDPFTFPGRVNVLARRYGLPMAVADLRARLEGLSFVGYQVSARREFSPALLRLLLLKRFESSRQAIVMTLQRQIRFYEQLIDSLTHGRALSPQLFRVLYPSHDDAVQLVLEQVALDPAPAQSRALCHDAERELTALRRWRSVLPQGDAKLHALIQLLGERGARAKTVVFTEYRDTARYLWRSLWRRFAVGLIDGAGAWLGQSAARRQEVVDRFAPKSNGAHVHAREAIQVLIATDVLAEGMNLQDADAVVSYDLPWNPVRLIQRAGRVDRMGSEHAVVEVHNFIPDREFDALLGLARTLRTKIDTVRRTVGLDHAVLEPDEDFDALARRVARSDALSFSEPVGEDLEAELRARFEPRPATPDIPVGVLGSPGRPTLVGLAAGTKWKVVASQPGGWADLDADATLLEALKTNRLAPMNEAVARVAAEEALAFVRMTSSLEVHPLARQSVQTRVAEKVLRAASELSFDSGSVYDDAEAVLRLIQTQADRVDEAAVERVLAQKHASQAVFLRRLRGVLEGKRRPAELPSWRVTGVLIAD